MLNLIADTIIGDDLLENCKSVTFCDNRSFAAMYFHTVLRCFRTILLRLCLVNFRIAAIRFPKQPISSFSPDVGID